MITLPLDLTIDGVPHRVTRIGPDAVVYHLLGIDEATNELVRITPDTPEVGYPLTDDTTADDIRAHLANPPAPAAPVPAAISRARLIIAARRTLGLTEGAIYATISQIADPEQQETTRDLFECATEFRRHNAFIVTIATQLGLSAEQVDDFFRAAAALDLGDQV